MARVFAVTAAITSLRTDSHGRAEGTFTVTNVTGRPLRGRLEARAASPAQQAWLSVTGEAEREFAANATHQIVVKIAVPPGAPAAQCAFRLDAVSAQNPDEDFAEGPTVTVEVAPQPAAKKPFPWWIVAAAAAVVLIAGGVTTYLLTRDRAPAPAASNTPPPTEGSPAPSKEVTPKEPVPAATDGVTVPNFVGTSGREAAVKAAETRLTVVQQTRDVSSGTQDVVLEQNPVAGGSVKAGTPITLVVANLLIPVPNLVGRPRADAVNTLGGQQLAVLESRKNAVNRPQDSVIEQDPKPGTTVRAGTPVSIIVADATCGPRHDTLGNDYVFIHLEVPETKAGTTHAWSDAALNKYVFPRCYRVKLVNYKLACVATATGTEWKQSGSLERTALCHNEGNLSQPFMRTEVR